MGAKYKIDNDMTGTKEGCQPQFLTKEAHHNRYSVDSAMKHYKDKVYYKQRKGGDGWFHGRVTNGYRNNYERTFGGQ